MRKDFLSGYKPQVKGIRNIKMNKPIVNVTKKGTIGLELEIEGNNLPGGFDLGHIAGNKTGAAWVTHNDGSLRGEALEYVFTSPCDEEELEPLVTGLFDTFKSKKTKLTLSNRCSTHVHINMGGYKINELTSVLALWMAFEEPLIAYHGTERVKNHFCLSNNDTHSLINAWRNYLEGLGRPNAEGLKYTALNILTLWRFGSFEFRVGRGADTPEYVITWAKFLNRFCKYAKDTYKNPVLIGSNISEQGGVEMFRSICRDIGMVDFGEQVIENYGGVEAFYESCVKGFRNAQPFVATQPWNDWMPLIEREYIPNPFGKEENEEDNEAELPLLAPRAELNFIRHVPLRGRNLAAEIVEREERLRLERQAIEAMERLDNVGRNGARR